MKEAIYNIKGVDLNSIDLSAPLNKWFYDMLQKKEDELTIRDVSHMLRQEVYLDIAIPIAWRDIIENPLCGEMYEGQMIDLLIRVYANHPELKGISYYDAFQEKIQQVYKTYDWGSDCEKEEYENLLGKFRKLFT